MKRFLLIFVGILFFAGSTVRAETFKAVSLENFSTENPSPTYKVQIIGQEESKYDAIYKEGTIISGEVIKIKDARRCKRNAYFEFVPTEITFENKTQKIGNPEVYAKVVGYYPINKGNLAERAAKGTAGIVLKGIIGPVAGVAMGGVSFIEGVAQNENKNRIKSGFTKVYKDSPLVYFEEGKQLNLSPGDLIVIKIKKLKLEN